MANGYAVYDNDTGTWWEGPNAAYRSKGAATASFNACQPAKVGEDGRFVYYRGRHVPAVKIQDQKRYVVKAVNFVAAE